MNCLLKHFPIVLLLLWIALIACVELPWTSRTPADERATLHKVLLLSDALEKPKTWRYQAVLQDTCGTLQRQPQCIIYLPKDTLSPLPPHQAGDLLLVYDTLCGEHVFVRQATLLQPYTATGHHGYRLRLMAYHCRTRLEQQLAHYITNANHRALVESLVLGDRRHLSRDQRNAFSRSGAMHVLAVSGLHVGIVAQLSAFLLTLGGLLVIRWEKKGWRFLHRCLILLPIWVYAFISGLSTPVLRSALMCCFAPMHPHTTPRYVSFNRLAMAALIILIIDPSAITSVGFLLSFGAVFSLVAFSNWQPQVHNKPMGYVCSLSYSSLAAQLGTMPFTIVFFRQVAVWFFLSSMMVIPLAQLMMYSTFAGLALSTVPIADTLTTWCFRLSYLSADWMLAGVDWVQSLPGAVVYL